MPYYFSGVSIQNKRQSNMDSLFLKKREINKTTSLLVVVCDGVGSMNDGAFSSGAVASRLGAWFDKIENTEHIGIKMRDAVISINSEVTREAIEKNLKTATTLSTILFVESRYFICHVGDSRIYSFDGNILSQLTNDDVSETGKLTNYLGKNLEFASIQYSEGHANNKVFLICSDGLYKKVEEEYLMENFNANNSRQAKESVKKLSKYAIKKGEQDNITLALIKISF